jgi:ATP-dependent Clp protease protease subunit
MIERRIPAWFEKAREMAARVRSPLGQPFAAAKKDRIAKLYLFDAIGKGWTGAGIDPLDVAKALDEAKGSEELEVHISSPGGYVFDGLAIYNSIRAFQGKRTTYVDGLAASIASVIALAGDKVVTGEGGMWMIHQVMGGLFVMGTADEIEEAARKESVSLRKATENVLGIYTGATGQSVSQLSAWMTAETWMTAAEAKERGFTDEIAVPEKPAPAAAVLPLRPAATLSPEVTANMARARVAQLNERFPRASPGSAAAGQPEAGQHQRPGDRQKAKP